MTEKTKNTRGVFKFAIDGRVYYWLGKDAENARATLAMEVGVPIQFVKIIDKGRKQ